MLNRLLCFFKHSWRETTFLDLNGIWWRYCRRRGCQARQYLHDHESHTEWMDV